MTTEHDSQQTGFDAEYVKKIREEAAGWRTKYRELESEVAYSKVEAELARRGVKADPSWVTLKEGQKISEAVDALVKQHPHLVGSTGQPVVPTEETEPQAKPTPHVIRPSLPKAMTPGGSNTNSPGADPTSLYGKRTFEEIKKDPVARSKLRDHYRQLLASSSNQIDPTET
jgi:hypothetical protein